LKFVLVRREPETHDTENFYWQLIDGGGQPMRLKFEPGQFLRWILEESASDDRGTGRFFSIASSPTEEVVQLTTKFSQQRSSSFKVKLRTLQPGAALQAIGPLGGFVLPEDTSKPLVFIAGGIGITPFRSMLKFLDDTNNDSHQIQLLYACHTIADMAFRPLLDDMLARRPWLKVNYVIEAPPHGWTGESGRLDAARINNLCGGLAAKLIYISGPEPMARAFYDGLVQMGVPAQNMKTDYFPGYSDS
jgi:glycine betaine catabolism B